MKELISRLRERYGISVTNEEIISLAMTHSSYAHERALEGSNERLEFLGDAVLSAVVSDYLYRNYAALSEGEMSRVRAAIVCESSLARAAGRLGLGEFLLLGRSEELKRSESPPSILADAFESLVGAVFLEAGYDGASRLVLGVLEQGISVAVDDRSSKDYKTAFQEFSQRMGLGIPFYELEGESGPDHDKRFYVVAKVGEKVSGRGTGRNKKEAEQEAAREALLSFGYEL